MGVDLPSVDDNPKDFAPVRRSRMEKCGAFLNIPRNFVTKMLHMFFFLLGVKIAKYPVQFLVVSVILSLGISGGAFLLTEEFRSEYLWAEQRSEGFRDHKRHIERFDSSRVQNLILEVIPQDGNIWTPEILAQVYDVEEQVLGLNVRVGGKEFSYENLCSRPFRNAPCTMGSPLALWGRNLTVMREDPDIFVTLNFAYSNLQAVVGGVRRDSEGNINRVTALMITFLIDSDYFEEDREGVLAWEKEFLDIRFNTYPNFRVIIQAGRSGEDEIQRLVDQDTVFIAISIVLTLVFMSVILGKRTVVHSKVLLGATSLLTVMLSLGITFGLLGFFQIVFSPLSLLVIFIIVGIGVDDMIIMVDAFSELTSNSLSPEERLPLSLRISGPAITLTSVTNLVAFMCGSAIDMLSISSFCMTAGLAVFVLFILQILFFLGLNGLSVWLAQSITTGIPLSDGLPDDSYMQDYYRLVSEYFGDVPLTLELVVLDVDYSSPTIQNRIFALQNATLEHPAVTPPLVSWLTSYREWSLERNSSFTGPDFYPNLFLFLEENPFWENDLFMRNNVIEASRVKLNTRFADSASVRVSDTDEIRAIFAASDLPGYAYNFFFMFADRDREILRLIVLNLLLAGGAVIFILFLFLSPIVALLMGICIAMIDLDLFGMMGLLGIPFDATTLICLAMAVGLSVDYTAHIGIAYFAHPRPSGNEMVSLAMGEIGVSVMNGGLSTLLGVAVLSITNSAAFRIFFKMLFGIVLFGLLHGLIFFPVILSFLPGRFMNPEEMKSYTFGNEEMAEKEIQEDIQEEKSVEFSKE